MTASVDGESFTLVNAFTYDEALSPKVTSVHPTAAASVAGIYLLILYFLQRFTQILNCWSVDFNL